MSSYIVKAPASIPPVIRSDIPPVLAQIEYQLAMADWLADKLADESLEPSKAPDDEDLPKFLTFRSLLYP